MGPAKRGSAVLFVDTLDSDPEESEPRTHHEALPVVKGLKKGLNIWVYQYNYKKFWPIGCTSIMFADMLDGLVQPSTPSVNFKNKLDETVKVFWKNEHNNEEVHMADLEPGDENSFNTHTGHLFIHRSAATNAVLGQY